MFLHQTTTAFFAHYRKILLSYILFLHQTTTLSLHSRFGCSCLISCFYIKPQLVLQVVLITKGCLISCFYIKPQLVIVTVCSKLSCLISCFYIKPQLRVSIHFLTSVVLYLVSTSNHNYEWCNRCSRWCCLISCFYIKPQLNTTLHKKAVCCLISCFYIKPQLGRHSAVAPNSCLISCFYIKPQRGSCTYMDRDVVLYLVSTSNHNLIALMSFVLHVVLYLVSTSNHNIYCLYPYTSYNYKNITLYKMVV